MTYTVTIPSSWNPTRAALNDMLEAIIVGFQTAVPGIVRKYWSEVPASLTAEGPFVYQGPVHEQILHDMGTRQTVYTGTLGYVDVFADPQETNDRQNKFADYMREVFTANARVSVASGTGSIDAIFQQVLLIDGPTELVQGHARLTDMRVEFTFTVLEGRN